MADNHVTLAARDEKRRLEKEATTAIFLNLTKEVIEVQRMDVEAKKADAKVKLHDDEARRMNARGQDPCRGHKDHASRLEQRRR